MGRSKIKRALFRRQLANDLIDKYPNALQIHYEPHLYTGAFTFENVSCDRNRSIGFRLAVNGVFTRAHWQVLVTFLRKVMEQLFLMPCSVGNVRVLLDCQRCTYTVPLVKGRLRRFAKSASDCGIAYFLIDAFPVFMPVFRPGDARFCWK
ncbi:hypothetical protein EI94DRAFT_406637 [Lactarius quietus]|nr:hypothetical protein EI94DRAFT_406637 [Lactarius quietus]